MPNSINVQDLTADEIRDAVRENYGEVARKGPAAGCCGPAASCCTPASLLPQPSVHDVSAALGYSSEELAAAPEGSNVGLGCGNPQAIAELLQGEVVLDLGSGAGFDSFLAAQAVGDSGRVIGVDMTSEMVNKARGNAGRANLRNVEFRLGEIEKLPVTSESVDVIISNCVINLSPEKERVFNEAFRVLKSGGRLAISDIVATAELPESVRGDLALYAGCVSGAASIDELLKMLARVGFTNIKISPKDGSQEFIREWIPGSKIEDYVISASISAIKP